MDGSSLMDELGAVREALRHAERALEDERRRAQRYLDVSGTVILALDAEHRIAAVNRKGLEVLGYAEHALAGRGFAEAVVLEPERAPVRHKLRRLTQGGTAQVECGVITRHGDHRTVAWELTALRDPEGGIVGALASGEDVTERRRIE